MSYEQFHQVIAFSQENIEPIDAHHPFYFCAGANEIVRNIPRVVVDCPRIGVGEN